MNTMQAHVGLGAHAGHGAQGTRAEHGAYGAHAGHAGHGAHADHGTQGTHAEHGAYGTHAGHGTHADHGAHTAADTTAGVSLAAGGYTLAPVSAPAAVREQGKLSFRILHADGAPVTAFAPQHEKELHLIVVRSDGAQFRHVHPALDRATGTWSIPWTWGAAGSYRVFADFAALHGPEGQMAHPVTLTRTVEVAGFYAPVAPVASAQTAVDGLDVEIAGDLVPGSRSALTVTIRRDNAPVTTLQPYLGAFGHLVALREGDLAYLHVHPESTAPLRQAQGPEATSGPEVHFGAHVSTAGRYLLYFDFQLDGSVHTASFVLDAKASHNH